jgi:hypothetical protein
MSLRDYEIFRELSGKADWSEDFYALIMTAMSKADDSNLAKLKAAWPEVWGELETRYNAPAGLLVGEKSLDGKMERREDGLYEAGKLVRAL